ncbi:acyl-homoserine-lactone synthase [Chromobacterium alticapitis]|uniref:Acyl-homoserine-lactone synthase n=1 Tax=Chromobacterium alticapitis TaxID=2073169 RepID=A0A2S5DD94_9NEIS|nr:acyl-homoserine-lactone synthase [Chromobacterium alticapitis]POZ61065.1 hypothetical protein C2I19_15345 [Chromobacterium alticapitis]
MGNFYSLTLDGLSLDLVSDAQMEAYLMRFRHRIFREALGWVPVSPSGMDRDEYDALSHNLAVSWRGSVVGSMRFTPGERPYMLESDFAQLLCDGDFIRKGRGSAEVSRFAVDASLPADLRAAASRLLYLGLWQWAEWNDVRWMYFVVVPGMYRRLQSLGLPVHPMGGLRPLDGGVMSMAGYFDWHAVDMDAIHSLRESVALSDACPERWREYDYSH